MLRIYVAHGLPDEGIEDALCDSRAIRGFVGADLSREAAPDATRIAAPPSAKNRERRPKFSFV